MVKSWEAVGIVLFDLYKYRLTGEDTHKWWGYSNPICCNHSEVAGMFLTSPSHLFTPFDLVKFSQHMITFVLNLFNLHALYHLIGVSYI